VPVPAAGPHPRLPRNSCRLLVQTVRLAVLLASLLGSLSPFQRGRLSLRFSPISSLAVGRHGSRRSGTGLVLEGSVLSSTFRARLKYAKGNAARARHTTAAHQTTAADSQRLQAAPSAPHHVVTRAIESRPAASAVLKTLSNGSGHRAGVSCRLACWVVAVLTR
jgi:hypothetical protein